MGSPNLLVPIALVAFIPATIASVRWLGMQRGIVAAMMGGWLFLPSFDGYYTVSVFRGKGMFVGAVLLVTSLVLDLSTWRRLRLRLLDAPMAAFCLLPLATSLSNGLGAYDGAQAVLETTMTWGAPYVLGRLYLGEMEALRRFANTLAVSGLVYVPFCLWEVRMSPHLNMVVYGFRTTWFAQVIRGEGYRPSVFMRDGLMLAMFLAAATLASYWTWRTGARRLTARLPSGVVWGLLTVTTLLTKSVGAIILLAVGIAALEATRRFRRALPLVVLLAIPPAYCAARIVGWAGTVLVDASKRAIAEERAQSLEFRMSNEDLLIEKALQRPWLGWGGWGRSRVYDDDGRDVSITDGLWIIVLGIGGFSSLIALALVLNVPALVLLRLFPSKYWDDPRLAAPVALTTALVLWQIDEVLNAMVSPIYPTIAGAIVSFGHWAVASRASAATKPRSRV